MIFLNRKNMKYTNIKGNTLIELNHIDAFKK